jgi:citrate lyase subunit beta/citryl-CoA lyase
MLIRINSIQEHGDEDLDVAVCPGAAGVMIPKCHCAREVLEAVHLIAEIERKKGIEPNTTRIFPMIESARAVIELPKIAAASRRIAALVLGAEDWCLDMGIARTNEGRELDFVRWSVSVCAHANGLLAMDTPFADFRDAEGLRADSDTARRMGFSGKLAIHPSQLAAIHDIFAPSEAEIAAASAIVSAFMEAEGRGEGVLNLNGKMVDRPIADRARKVLANARK